MSSPEGHPAAATPQQHSNSDVVAAPSEDQVAELIYQVCGLIKMPKRQEVLEYLKMHDPSIVVDDAFAVNYSALTPTVFWDLKEVVDSVLKEMGHTTKN